MVDIAYPEYNSARERERDGNGRLKATNIEDITDMREKNTNLSNVLYF